jgi:hypothetical protein
MKLPRDLAVRQLLLMIHPVDRFDRLGIRHQWSALLADPSIAPAGS